MSDCDDIRDNVGSENDCGNRKVADLKGKVEGFLVHLRNSSAKHVKVKQPKAQPEAKSKKNSSVRSNSTPKRKTMVCSEAFEDREKDVANNQSEKEVPKRVLNVKIPPTPKLLTVVEKRTRLRAQRIEEIRVMKHEKQLELQKELEAEMKRTLEAQEMERIAKEMEERNMKESAEMEKKRINRLKRLAIKHHNLRLMRRIFVRLRKIVQAARIKMIAMEEFYRKKIVGFVLKLWKANVDLKIAEKTKASSDFYQLKLFRNCFRCWKKVCKHYSNSRQAADDLFELHFSRTVFNRWLRFTRCQRKVFRRKIVDAEQHHERKLLATFFHAWTSYPPVKKLEQEKEKIKLILRLKVKDCLQDFEPTLEDDEMFH